METCNKTKQLNISFRAVISISCLTLIFLGLLILGLNKKTPPSAQEADDVAIMNVFDSLISSALSEAEDAALNVPKKFWIREDAVKGPVPNPDNYGTTDDPSTLQWLLDDAQELLQGQKTLFSTNIILRPGSVATYYLDDTIFAITWKQVIEGCVYTISEIKIADPSQFRRHLEGGVFDGPTLSVPSLMSQSVNAVVGTSADHYRGRRAGIIVYDGEVKRIDVPHQVDVCYVDKEGNLLFSYAGEFMDKESAQNFVDANNISFSIAFGPVLIENGQRREITYYKLGEIWDEYARAALCQMGPLHYVVVTANAEVGYLKHLTIHDFAKQVEKFGCQMAYTLDGGNTGSIVMNGKLINRTTYGYERMQGDILYFCTAIPNATITENQRGS